MSSSGTLDPGTSTIGSTPVAEISMQWSVLAADQIGNLGLTTEQDGSVTGSLFGDSVAGFWDEDSQTLTFMRVGDGEDLVDHTLYRAHRFSVDSQWGQFEAMAGIVESFTGPRESPDIYRSGWFAILREIGGDDHGASEHLWNVISEQLPDPKDINATTGGDLNVVVANGHVGPWSMQNTPHHPPGGPVWVAMFNQPSNEHSHGEVGLTKSGQRGTVSLIRPPTTPSGDGTDYQVFRGGKLLGRVGSSKDFRHIVGWAGSFTALAGTGGQPGRTEYGWFAVSTAYTG